MRTTYVLAIMIFVVGCSTKNETNSDLAEGQVKKDTIQLLEGIWAENEEDNAMFRIVGDSIVNVDDRDKMHLKVIDGVLVINYGDFVGKHQILEVTEDSLILRNEDQSILRLYKRR